MNKSLTICSLVATFVFTNPVLAKSDLHYCLQNFRNKKPEINKYFPKKHIPQDLLLRKYNPKLPNQYQMYIKDNQKNYLRWKEIPVRPQKYRRL